MPHRVALCTMGQPNRWPVPYSPLCEKIIAELLERWPWSSRAALAAHALERGLVEMRERPYVASGAPMVEWRKVG